MHFYRKCLFDLFKKHFYPFEVWPKLFCATQMNLVHVTNAWKRHSVYTAFTSNVGAWGMWACSLFLSLWFDIVLPYLAHMGVSQWDVPRTYMLQIWCWPLTLSCLHVRPVTYVYFDIGKTIYGTWVYPLERMCQVYSWFWYDVDL